MRVDLTPRFGFARFAPQVGDIVTMETMLNGSIQELVMQAQNALVFNEGVTTMFIADMPNVPLMSPALVMMAQASSSQQIASQRGHEIGVCGLLNSNRGSGGQFDVSPTVLANGFVKDVNIVRATAVVTILQQPKQGHLEPDARGNWTYSKYIPNDGYFGHDSFSVQVEGNGYKVTLRYFVYMTEDDGESINPNPICKGAVWKISLDANGNQVLTAVDSASPSRCQVYPCTPINNLLITFEYISRQLEKLSGVKRGRV